MTIGAEHSLNRCLYGRINTCIGIGLETGVQDKISRNKANFRSDPNFRERSIHREQKNHGLVRSLRFVYSCCAKRASTTMSRAKMSIHTREEPRIRIWEIRSWGVKME